MSNSIFGDTTYNEYLMNFKEWTKTCDELPSGAIKPEAPKPPFSFPFPNPFMGAFGFPPPPTPIPPPSLKMLYSTPEQMLRSLMGSITIDLAYHNPDFPDYPNKLIADDFLKGVFDDEDMKEVAKILTGARGDLSKILQNVIDKLRRQETSEESKKPE